MATEVSATFSLPHPLPPPPQPLISVGRHAPSSVDAEDFSRRIGAWGGAAHLIGDRWEQLAPGLLRRRLPWTFAAGGHAHTVIAVLALDADPAAGPLLQRAGISAPDLLLVAVFGAASPGRVAEWGAASTAAGESRLPSFLGSSSHPGEGQREGAPGVSGVPRLLLRAADCKVSLDTAERDQTAPARLQTAFARIARGLPEVVEALRRQVAALAEPARALAAAAIEAALAGDWQRVAAGEGLFVAPESGFNRWFLGRLAERRRTGAPLGRLPASGPRRPAAEVNGPVSAELATRLALPAHLEPVDAASFLGPLPGWPEAAVVAELDGLSLGEADLSVAERCWRVGVGLRGAILALRRPLFQPALQPVLPDGTPRDVAAVLRQVAARRRLRDSAGLVAAVAHSLAARRPLWEREAALLQAPLPFSAWLELIAAAQRALESGAGPEAILVAGAGPDGEPGPSSLDPRELPLELRTLARALHREMAARHRQRIVEAAAALSRDGDAALLQALEDRRAEWKAVARADAWELVRRALDRPVDTGATGPA